MAALRTAVSLLMLRAVASAPPDANSSRGLSDAGAPGHAGCFVMKGNAMLAVKLTYDGNKFDIPGGQTNWREPARKTAERETWEESGYSVEAHEIMATVRGGFHIFRQASTAPYGASCQASGKKVRRRMAKVSCVGLFSLLLAARCTLKQQEPGKGPDHEVSSVQWMNPGEVDSYMGHLGFEACIGLGLCRSFDCVSSTGT